MKRSTEGYIGSALLIALSWSASAQEADLRSGIARCAAASGELARLACYDELAKSAGLTASTSSNATPDGNWRVQQTTNPVDDSTTVVLINIADEGKASLGRPIGLVIRCASNTTNAYINWQDYLGSEANVLTRIGTSPATTQRWSLSTDKQATFVPRDDIGFIKQLLTADTFVAQVTPYNENPITAVWNIKGLATAIEPLRSTCSW